MFCLGYELKFCILDILVFIGFNTTAKLACFISFKLEITVSLHLFLMPKNPLRSERYRNVASSQPNVFFLHLQIGHTLLRALVFLCVADVSNCLRKFHASFSTTVFSGSPHSSLTISRSRHGPMNFLTLLSVLFLHGLQAAVTHLKINFSVAL